MSMLRLFWLLLCCYILSSCNSGSTTPSTIQNASLNPIVTTLADGTTITIPISTVYVPFEQTIQIPITIVGGSLANGESLSISASSPQSQTSTANVAARVDSSTNTPTVTTSPAWVNVSPGITYTIYLNVSDGDGATGTYSTSLTVKSADTIIIVPIRLPIFIEDQVCTASELQSCRQTTCFAYVSPATASLNQANLLQYHAIAIMNYPNECFADITEQTTWNSNSESIASINSFGQAAGINVGDTVITADSNAYNINYRWSESSPLSVVPAVPYPGGYGYLSITNLSDVTYSCANGLNKPIYIKVNDGMGILSQTVSGWVWLTGYVVYVSKENIGIDVGSTGYGETLALTAGHPFSTNVKECQDQTPYHLNITYGGYVNGYTYPSVYPLSIRVVD